MKKCLLLFTIGWLFFSSVCVQQPDSSRIDLDSALDDPTDMQAKHIARASELLSKEIEELFALLELRIKIYRISLTHSKLIQERNMFLTGIKTLSKQCIGASAYDIATAWKKLHHLEQIHSQLVITLENFDNLLKS